MTEPLDLELASVSRKLHAFKWAFCEIARMRKRLQIDPRAAIALADSLENDGNALITAARLLRHQALQQPQGAAK
jgi:hypothetical protein